MSFARWLNCRAVTWLRSGSRSPAEPFAFHRSPHGGGATERVGLRISETRSSRSCLLERELTRSGMAYVFVAAKRRHSTSLTPNMSQPRKIESCMGDRHSSKRRRHLRSHLTLIDKGARDVPWGVARGRGQNGDAAGCSGREDPVHAAAAGSGSAGACAVDDCPAVIGRSRSERHNRYRCPQRRSLLQREPLRRRLRQSSDGNRLNRSASYPGGTGGAFAVGDGHGCTSRTSTCLQVNTPARP